MHIFGYWKIKIMHILGYSKIDITHILGECKFLHRETKPLHGSKTTSEKSKNNRKQRSQRIWGRCWFDLRRKNVANKPPKFYKWSNMWSSPFFSRFSAKKEGAFSGSHNTVKFKKLLSGKEKTEIQNKPPFWSKWRDSNSRPPVPERRIPCHIRIFLYFSVLFSPQIVLFRPPRFTLSA